MNGGINPDDSGVFDGTGVSAAATFEATGVVTPLATGGRVTTGAAAGVDAGVGAGVNIGSRVVTGVVPGVTRPSLSPCRLLTALLA